MENQPTLLGYLMVLAAVVSHAFLACFGSASEVDFERVGVRPAAALAGAASFSGDGEDHDDNRTETGAFASAAAAAYAETAVPAIQNAAVEAAVQDYVFHHHHADPPREALLRRLVASMMDQHLDLTTLSSPLNVQLERLDMMLRANGFDVEETAKAFVRLTRPR